MKSLLVLVILTVSTNAVPCDPTVCLLPDCLCASDVPPLDLTPNTIPQLVFFTFHEALNTVNSYTASLFDGRTNPDSCPVTATYFVSHEYSDYREVHSVWVKGHEIALNSITRQTPVSHWQTLTVDGHKKEFADQIKLMSKFAEIPETDIKGIRVPYLQLSGDNSFQMIKDSGLSYDCSWPTQESPLTGGLFPYTLDYDSIQECPIGPCPTSPIPGVWVVPMNDLKDRSGYPCAVVDGCYDMPTTDTEIFELLKANFLRHYEGNRVPFGVHGREAWFKRTPASFNAYGLFLEYLQTLQDVYVVSVQKGLEWMRDPKVVAQLGTDWSCTAARTPACSSSTSCRFTVRTVEERNMGICEGTCPNTYPWLDNPLGV